MRIGESLHNLLGQSFAATDHEIGRVPFNVRVIVSRFEFVNHSVCQILFIRWAERNINS